MHIMLSHLVYISKRLPSCTDVEIAKILASCQANNGKIDVTGVLLYSPKQFVQYLEGDYEKIRDLYDKIKLDKRHERVMFISCTPIKERLFPSWQMGGKELDFDSIDYKTNISAEDKQVFKQILTGKESTRAMGSIQRLFL